MTRSHATNIRIFENSSLVEVSGAPEKLHYELSEMRYESILCSGFSQEALITFYTSLPVFRLSELC
jgi:hypothetical protein